MRALLPWKICKTMKTGTGGGPAHLSPNMEPACNLAAMPVRKRVLGRDGCCRHLGGSSPFYSAVCIFFVLNLPAAFPRDN